MSRLIPFSICLIIVFLHSLGAQGRTWYVAKDGTGDFSTLQPAAEAAASGDTIRIGAGRYTEFADYSCDLNNPIPKLIVPMQHELTIMGAGPDSTVFARPDGFEDFMITGIYAQQSCGVEHLYVSGIGFDFFAAAILGEYGTTLVVDNCKFYKCHKGVNTDFHHLTVTNCQFEGADGFGGYFVSGYAGGDAQTFYMDNCTYDNQYGNFPVAAMNYGTLESFLIKNSTFNGANTFFNTGEPLHHCIQEVQNCIVTNCVRGAAVGAGRVKISHCRFENMEFGIIDFSVVRSRLDISYCTFSNVEIATLWHYGFKGGSIRNCRLEKGWAGVVTYDPFAKKPEFQTDDPDSVYYLDMTNNWWGTSEPDSIRAWIEDGHDVPGLPCIVEWEPLLVEEVPTKSTKLGGLKSFFRR